jgi:ubiquinone/menaquinone biosynthesis C-methylase UbiE
MSLAHEFTEHYSEYYGDLGLAQLRSISAADKANSIMSLCSGIDHASIVEFGFGDGAVLAELDRLGFAKEFTGYEVSNSGLDYASRRRFKTRVSLKHFNGCNTSDLDKQYDVAVLSHVVEHLKEPRTLICEASRVAKYVFIEVPLEYRLMMPHDFKWDETGHVNYYSNKLLRYLVQSCGLTVVKEHVYMPSLAVYKSSFPSTGLYKWLVKRTAFAISKNIASRLFTFHGCVLAKDATKSA